ncbi:hypothetical protein ABJI51_16665 [Amycolatopsis sp. NEAU-NG30]|uniref:Lipoprotein n=1 Tax=Amycolatopsis melonis TaxID=3156488 RepID=A0ABV0LEX3_9PSEU
MRLMLPFFCAFAALTLAGCAVPAPPPSAPSSAPPIQPASPVPDASGVPFAEGVEHPAATAAREWARRWCGWSWRDPFGAREARARELMTAAAGRALVGTAADTWQRDVVGAHESATCSSPSVWLTDGPRGDTRVYVAITAQRTVVSDDGLVSSPFRDDRRMSLVDGRWLVDVAVAGG